MLADFILKNSRKVVFMTTKELARTSGVSEATVIRFVSRLNYSGYTAFLKDVRDLVDTELKLVDRLELPDRKDKQAALLRNVVLEEIVNLQHFYSQLDLDATDQAVELLKDSPTIFVTGSRLSYALAYYFGWSLIKIRQNVHILQGSDSTAIDYLTIAPPDSLVVIIATTHYPNDLIRAGKYARRLERKSSKGSRFIGIVKVIHGTIVHVMLVPAVEGIPIQFNPQPGTLGYRNNVICLTERSALDYIGDLPPEQGLTGFVNPWHGRCHIFPLRSHRAISSPPKVVTAELSSVF